VRLRSEIWVKAYLRTCQAQTIPAIVVRRGDEDAGAVYIKVNRLDGTARLFGPSPGGSWGGGTPQTWMAHMDGSDVSEKTVDDFLNRQVQFDCDIWIIEVEDKKGQHCLDAWLE